MITTQGNCMFNFLFPNLRSFNKSRLPAVYRRLQGLSLPSIQPMCRLTCLVFALQHSCLVQIGSRLYEKVIETAESTGNIVLAVELMRILKIAFAEEGGQNIAFWTIMENRVQMIEIIVVPPLDRYHQDDFVWTVLRPSNQQNWIHTGYSIPVDQICVALELWCAGRLWHIAWVSIVAC